MIIPWWSHCPIVIPLFLIPRRSSSLIRPRTRSGKRPRSSSATWASSAEKNGSFTQQNMVFTGFHHAKYGFYQAKDWFYPAKDCFLQQNMDVRRILARKIFILTKNESLTNWNDDLYSIIISYNFTFRFLHLSNHQWCYRQLHEKSPVMVTNQQVGLKMIYIYNVCIYTHTESTKSIQIPD